MCQAVTCPANIRKTMCGGSKRQCPCYKPCEKRWIHPYLSLHWPPIPILPLFVPFDAFSEFEINDKCFYKNKNHQDISQFRVIHLFLWFAENSLLFLLWILLARVFLSLESSLWRSMRLEISATIHRNLHLVSQFHLLSQASFYGQLRERVRISRTLHSSAMCNNKAAHQRGVENRKVDSFELR